VLSLHLTEETSSTSKRNHFQTHFHFHKCKYSAVKFDTSSGGHCESWELPMCCTL